MNCSSPATAAAAARRLPENFTPEVARKLLLTAATRQHTEVLEMMIKLPAVQQHIDVPTLEPVLQLLIAKAKAGCAVLLLELPAAAQLPSDAVCRLLQIAALQGAGHVAAQLCRLPGAQQMSCSELAGLLTQCSEGSTDPLSDDLDEALQRFTGGGESIQSILKLPAAQQLSYSTILQLMRLCCKAGTGSSLLLHEGVRALGCLPAAQVLSSQELVQQILAAVQQGDYVTVESMNYISAAQEISSEQLLQLLTAVTLEPSWSSQKCTAVQRLCSLPATVQISSEDIARLILAALEQGKLECMGIFWNLPEAGQDSSKSLTQLLDAAVKIHNRIHTEVMMSCPPGMPHSKVDSRLESVLRSSRYRDCIEWLLRMVWIDVVKHCDAKQTAAALKVAVLWTLMTSLTELCSLPAANLLSSEQVTAALEAAVVQGSEGCTLLLCRLPAAQQLSKKEVGWLLATAEQHDSHKCAAVLRRLPAHG
jgi:hypothetical protein